MCLVIFRKGETKWKERKAERKRQTDQLNYKCSDTDRAIEYDVVVNKEMETFMI